MPAFAALTTFNFLDRPLNKAPRKFIANRLNVREAALRLKIGRTALYEALKDQS